MTSVEELNEEKVSYVLSERLPFSTMSNGGDRVRKWVEDNAAHAYCNNTEFNDHKDIEDIEVKKEDFDFGVKLEKLSNYGGCKNEGDKDKIQISIFGVQEIKFRVKKNRKLSMPLRMYSQRLGLPLGTFRFVYDGVRVTENDTPESLGMSEGDVVEVYKNQLGGSS